MAENKLVPPSRNALLDAYYGNPMLMRQGQRMNLPARQAPGPLSEFATQAVSLDPQPGQDYGTMAAEMALGFVPGVGQAMAARDIERARREDDPLGMGLAASSFIPFGKMINALRGRKQMGPVSEMDTWHGSPHRFPPTANNPLGEFDPMKIGTGEGAQVYGAGAGYLAGHKEVGSMYRDKLDTLYIQYKNDSLLGKLGLSDLPMNVKSYLSDAVKQSGITDPIALRTAIERSVADPTFKKNNPASYSDAVDALKFNWSPSGKVFGEKGYLYKVDLPDEQIAKMLDWDKPLSQQPHLMNQTGPHGPDFTFKNLLERFGVDPANTTGKQFLQEVGMGRGREKAVAISKTLSEYGIPGIRYLDAGSRNINSLVAGGKGTSNFVVFDPKHMNIIGRE